MSVEWDRYRKCDMCGAQIGEPCMALSGYNADGSIKIVADRPHSGRKLRAGRDG